MAWDQEMPIPASPTPPTRDEVDPSEYEVPQVIASERSESMLISLSILY